MTDLIITGNWKMNTTIEEANSLATQVGEGLENIDGVEVVLCPPFVSIASVKNILRSSSIKIGAQNMYHEPAGPYTGEVSSTMLSNLCHYVILGHSERRHILGETDAMIGKKIKAAVAAGIRPILCVGETIEDRRNGKTQSVVEHQLMCSISGLDQPNRLVVAYEPVWAIGTGIAATPKDAEATMSDIREVLAGCFGTDHAQSIPLLYGGSVTAGNIVSFLCQRNNNGALVGGASLDAGSFVKLVRNTMTTVR